ncbi:MAG: general secretion pathway protein GspB [Desulfuromonadales bacterium]
MMSFILDALKKSEQQRQEGQKGPRPVRKKTLAFGETRRARWPFRFLIVVLLLVGFGAGWLWLASQEAPIVVDVTPTSTPTEDSIAPMAAKQAVEAAPKTLSTPAAEAPEIAVSDEVAPKTASVPATEAPELTVPVEAAPVPRPFTKTVKQAPAAANRASTALQEQQTIVTERSDDGTAETSPAPTVEPSKRPEPLNDMPRYSDLSRELRSRLPELAMSMHFYTDNPARRLVRINGRLLHQGENLNQDLEVVEITPEGAVLETLGLSFLLVNPSR